MKRILSVVIALAMILSTALIATAETAVSEKYEIDTSSIVWGNKTTGTGYVTLTQGEATTEDRYVFVQWTWVTKGGDNIVSDTCIWLESLGEGKYAFNAKSVGISGATLDNFVIIVTDDGDASDFSCNNLGVTVMKK